MNDLIKFYHPDWDWTAIDNRIESECSDDACKNDAWYKASLEWLAALSEVFGNNYQTEESDNFLLLSSEDKSYRRSVLDFSEKALNCIYTALGTAANDSVYGKRVIIVIHSYGFYQSYVEAFFPEFKDDFLVSGEFVDLGYEHSVFPYQNLSITEPILVGHLVGGVLCHLPLPTWLLEGVRSEMINQITSYGSAIVNDELLDRHRMFWSDEKIEHFLSGDLFNSSGDGCGFSMELARILVREILYSDDDKEKFSKFLENANYQDAGESAFCGVYGTSLRSFIAF